MVLKGQFLERPTLVPVGDVVLEGLSHRGTHAPPLLIVPPIPAEGGSMDHVVCAEVAWAAAMAGHPTLRFNYRGVGASQGTRGEGLADDVEAAMRLLVENAGVASIAVLAVGGSAPVALELLERHPALGGLVLVNPVELAASSLAELSLPLLVLLAEHSDRTPRAALSASVTQAGGTLEVISGADPAFTRNLTQVGRSVAAWLAHLRG